MGPERFLDIVNAGNVPQLERHQPGRGRVEKKLVRER